MLVSADSLGSVCPILPACINFLHDNCHHVHRYPYCESHQNVPRDPSSQQPTQTYGCVTDAVSGVTEREKSGSWYVCRQPGSFAVLGSSNFEQADADSIPKSVLHFAALGLSNGVFDLFFKPFDLHF